MDKQTILSVKDLRITFGGDNPFIAVNKVSFELQRGKTLAIVGESGSGKSLTALALMGLLPHTAHVKGSVYLNAEKDVIALHELGDSHHWQAIRGKEAGMVFQEPMSSLNPVMLIGKQISESVITHQNVSKQEAKNIAKDWLKKVQLPNPEKIYNRYPHQLSGGQKQRVMIAMAMCNYPVLLIADEPTTALDVTVQMEVIRLMQELQQQTGTAMIFITHDLALATKIADELLVMLKGEMVEYGSAEKIFLHPQHPYTKALIACKPSPDHKGQVLPTVSDFLEKPSILNPPQSSILTPHPSTISLLQVNNLRVWFSDQKDWLGRSVSYYKAVNDVSFTLHKGEVLGLVGESGCGKSTLSRSLLGLIPIHDGQIIYQNKDLAKTNKEEWKQVRKEIQMIFQDPFASLNPRMNIGDMLMEPMMVHGIVPKKELEKEAQRLLDLVHLPSNSMKRYPHQFSGGQRQRLGIARALALRPKLLICDESVSALDVSVQAQILNLLKELQGEFDLSYLFISHDLSVVHYISDRVMVMQAGKIVESGEAVKVLQHPENEYTKKLIASIPEKR
ncbi:MAG TPA: ABC transporter ATP-binding protein [Flavipsychrobacter sp.]|nr:ABC transporter ATP-binding protein [Flavipsychrobacter sp.]